MQNSVLLFLIFILIGSCGPSDSRVAVPPDPDKQAFYDFFNDVRLQIDERAGSSPHLATWIEQTKAFLESSDVQRMYRVAGVYFENHKNREQGAWSFEDRFFDNGAQIHLVFYPLKDKERYQDEIGKDKTFAKEVADYLFVYQLFTANPTDEKLERNLRSIVEQTLDRYQPKLSASDEK